MDKSVVQYDWTGTFRPDAWRLPAYKKYDYQMGELRNLFINWKDVQDAAAAGATPPLWAVYCDVLRLDADVSIDRTTIIFARRIELAKDLSFVIDRTGGGEVSLLLYAQEVINYNTGNSADLTVVEIAGGDSETSATWKRSEGWATGLVWMAGKAAVVGSAETMPPEAAYLLDDEPLRLLLATTFQVATLLCTSKPDLSMAQLRWIQALAAANQDTMDISLQAEAMANNLQMQQQAGADSVLVPFLDSSVYAESAKNLMDLLKQRDTKWAALQSMKKSDERWQQIIEDSIGDKDDQHQLNGQLQKQAEDSLMQAWNARSIAARLIVEQKSTLQACKNTFDVGIEHWKLDKSLSEGFKIFLGILDILKEIPAIVAGGPAFVAVDIIPAANSLINGLSGIAGALKNTISNAGGGGGGNAGGGGNDNAGGNAGNNAGGNDAGGNNPGDDDYGDLAGDMQNLFNDDYMNNIGGGNNNAGGNAGGNNADDDDYGDLAGDMQDMFGNNDAGGGNAGGGDAGGNQPADAPKPGPDKKAVKKLIAEEKKAQAEREKASAAFTKAIGNAAGGAADVANAAMRIVKISARAAALEATSARILGSINKTVGDSFSSVELKGLDVVTGGALEWDLLGKEIENVFEKVSELDEINGGNAYRLEFRKLIVKGKALSEGRLAVAKATFQVAEMRLRTLMAEKSLRRSKLRMEKLKAEIQSTDSLQQYAFNKVLDSKRQVYMALESYRRAFQYFTLLDAAKVPRLPSLLDTVDEFHKTVSNIAGKQLVLTAAFWTQTPQGIDKDILIDDPNVIDKLRTLGVTTWTLRYNDDLFKNLARIRITDVSVYVVFNEGYKYEKEISVRILTSGQYSDKNLHRGEKLFVGPPIHKNFEYRFEDGKLHTTAHGNIALRFANDFFNPTPFTTWTISFNDPGFDLKQIKALKMTFSGTGLSI